MKYVPMHFYFFIILILSGLHETAMGQASGLILNETSNGTSGSKEFMELLVVGPCGTTVDVRNWIIDDNNGDFDPSGAMASAGIAQGHLRFKNVAAWQNVPVGSLILVYNEADKNTNITLADDPNDSNADNVYIVPGNDAGMEYTTTLPSTTNSTYTPASYSQPANFGSTMGLRNAGDAAQVRKPDGTYFHGISWGTVANNMTGGPDNLLVQASDGTGKNYYFNSVDYRSVSNFSVGTAGTASETPGAPNNAANLSYINNLKTSCTTPVTWVNVSFSQVDNKITWTVGSERNVIYYTVEGSNDASDFQIVGIEPSTQATSAIKTYTHSLDDREFKYYRIRETDSDGSFLLSKIIYVADNSDHLHYFHIYPNPVSCGSNFILSGTSMIDQDVDLRIYNLQGVLVFSETFRGEEKKLITPPYLLHGMYTIILRTSTYSQTKKLLVY